jgi:hypothetical protein
VVADQERDRVAAERPAAAGREQRVVWPAASFCEPLPEHGDGLAGQRRRAVFAAFAEYLDVRAGGEVHVLAAEAGELADAQPGLDREREQGVIATSEPSILVGGGQERVDLVGGEVGDDRAVEAFGRDGEHAADQCGVLGVSQRCVAEHRVDRRQPGVPGPHAVAALLFEVIEERGDQGGVEVLELERGWLLPGPLVGEAEQQPEGVSVGGDRVRADALLADQPAGEERLERRRERGHRRAPWACSRRSAASASSSGAADRYQ